jgi:hypothetical protein
MDFPHVSHHLMQQFKYEPGRRMNPQGCLAAYLQGKTGHTQEQREKVDRSRFIVSARQRVIDDFHGDVQTALASSHHGQFGKGKGSSGRSAEDLHAAQAQRTKNKNAERKRGMAQVKITNARQWEGLPLAVRKRVLADPDLTLAQAKADPDLTLAQAKAGSAAQPLFSSVRSKAGSAAKAGSASGVQQQPVQESGVQQQPVQPDPDFDFTNDDDIEDI